MNSLSCILNLRLIFDYIDILSILVIIINNKNVISSLIDLHYQLIQTNIDNDIFNDIL